MLALLNRINGGLERSNEPVRRFAVTVEQQSWNRIDIKSSVIRLTATSKNAGHH